MARCFRIEQAERLLPRIERTLQELLPQKKAFDELKRELHGAARRITLAGGYRVDPEALARKRRDAETLKAAINSTLESVQQCGCVVKDLDLGLVDFPALLHGEEICLCWKLGERRITYWHRLSEGFAGRKPIDEEFRAAHGS